MMRHAWRLMLGTSILCTACLRAPQANNTFGTHSIPGDSRKWYMFCFHDKLRAVLTYGDQERLEVTPPHVIANGRKVDIPREAGVYVVDPDLKFHRASITVKELHAAMYTDKGHYTDYAEGFYDCDLWREQLYPLLKQHAWP